MRHLNSPAGEVHGLRFGPPEGRSLYLLSDDARPRPPVGRWEKDLFQHALRIDTTSGKVTGQWFFSGSEVAIFTPDFRHLYHSVSVAVSGGELDLERIDLVTGKSDWNYYSDRPYPQSVAFTPNGHILAVGGRYWTGGDGRSWVHRLDVWHRTELDPLEFQADLLRPGVGCLAYSTDARILAAASPHTGVRTWLGKQPLEHFPEPASALAWSPDGQLGWGHQDRLVVARPGSGEPVRPMSGAPGELTALEFSPDGKLLLAGTQQGTCSFTEATGQLLATFDWGLGPIHSVAFSPDGLTCAAGGESGQVVVWDVDA